MFDRDALARRWAPTHPRLRADDLVAPVDPVAPEEPDDSPSDAEEGETGVMVAFYLDDETADQLELCACDGECDCATCPDCPDVPDGVDPEDDDDLHLTLAYLGKAGADFDPAKEPDLVRAVSQWALVQQPVSAVVGGMGLFSGATDGPVTYASVDGPELPDARQGLVSAITAAGFTVARDHGFTPHITLCYGDARNVDVPNLLLLFTSVSVVVAGRRTDIPLGVETNPESLDPPTMDDLMSMRASVRDRDERVTSKAAPVGTDWAFATTVGKRTVVTTSASVAPSWNTALTPNQHMLWIQGRLVGGEEPNRNNAYWSSGDLEMGVPTVSHGPLNWLHEERHIIGTIADSKFIPRRDSSELAADTTSPHVVMAAGVWRWIYPEEASIIEMASTAGQLSSSMECISQQVACVGPTGCGQEYGYMDYLAGKTCAHLMERSAVRRFVQPTFLGAAVIVPPSRPGWADADMRVIASAQEQASDAYDQAGKPDITASNWEWIVAGAVQYAESLR